MYLLLRYSLLVLMDAYNLFVDNIICAALERMQTLTDRDA
jgi:hypothetical protein